ncbi:SWIM zinc finger family protein [Streptomyces mirabilis]|nr:SWIM zinc finger family protein [Streptomyces mirabilis]
MSPSLPGQRRAPARGRHAFAATWWGQAWVTALEDSTLDAGRLSRGRTYARKGMVGPTTIAPGHIKASVQGSQPRPYRSSVHLPVLTDAQWDTLLAAVAARAGHLAALLDGEMPAQLVDAARQAGVPLLPQPTELDPDCSCPDWGYPCKHAAALCYAIAATIDTDPFVLFALRGRSREEVLAQLRARRTTSPATDTPPAPAGIPPPAPTPPGPNTPQAARPPRTIPPRRRTAGPPTVRQRPVPHRPGTAHGRRSGTHNAAVVRRHHLPAPDPAPGRRTDRREQPRTRVVP